MRNSTYKVAGVAFLTLAALLFSLCISSAATLAQPLGQVTGQTLRIPAGQTARLRVRGLCIDFGKPFPGTSAAPNELAKDEMRAALNYAVSKGYFDKDDTARQAEQAMWYLSDGTWHRPDHDLAQEIVNAGKDAANKPADPAGATSILDALNAGTIKVDVSLTIPAGMDPKDAFYGDGDLSVTNTSNAEVNVFMPTGTIFPPNTAADQRLIGYALVAQEAPTLTPAPTNTPMPTATAAPTNTPAPTAMPQPTATPAMSSTLPSTGGPADGLPAWMLLLGGSLLSLVAGVSLLRRSPAV
jgi:hypothetical protein